MKHYFTSKLLLLACVLLGFSGNISAQTYKTVKLWDFTKWSEATIANLKADSEKPVAERSWYVMANEVDEANAVKRYKNWGASKAVLTANGVELEETKGLEFPSGLTGGAAGTVSADLQGNETNGKGDLNIRHNFGDNGIQLGSSKKNIKIKDLKTGQKITAVLKSAKDTEARGISAASNLEGAVGESTYKTGAEGEMVYELTVKADGDATLTYSSGIILKSIKVEEEATTPKVAFLCTAAYDAENDPSYKALVAAYEVTKVDIATLSDPVTLLSYDLVVVNSSITGTDANAMKLPEIVNAVPMLNFKSWFYGKSGSDRWKWAVAKNPSSPAVAFTVQEAFKGHAIFKDVTVAEDGTCVLFNEVTTPRGNLIQGYADPAEIIVNDDVLAKVEGYNAIHEHKSASGKNTYMLIPFEQLDADKLSDNGVKLIMNAAAYLIATKAVSATVETPEIAYEQEGKEMKVTITCKTADAKIYYTIDGSAPTESSNAYTAPFNIIKSCVVKAIAVKEDMVNSEIVEQEIENPNYIARNKTLLWVNFDDQPESWREEGEGQVDFWGKNGGTGTEKRAGGFVIESDKARILLMTTGVNETIGADYGPTTEADLGATSKSIQIGKGKNSGDGHVTTPATYAGPFDVAVWWCASSKAKETINVWVKTKDAEEWNLIGTASSSLKSITKDTFSYDGTDNVLVRVGGHSSGQFNIFDFKVLGEGQDPPVSITNDEANKEVEACEYYSISGIRLARPERGINIVKTIYTDGSVETSKVMVK